MRPQPALSRKNLWVQLPSSLRSVLGSAAALLPVDLLLGRRFRSMLRFVHDAEWWSAERTRQYQLQQLRLVCSLAANRSAYYRRLFATIGFDPRDLHDVKDLQRLPLLDRETVRRNPHDLLSASQRSPFVDAVSTSGTSGAPLHFWIGADRSAIEYAYLVAAWRRTGYALGNTMAVFKGDVVRPDRHGLRHEYDPLLRRHGYSTFHLSDTDLGKYLAHVSTIGPCYLLAYPSVVATMARYLRRTGMPPPDNIRGIIAESEIVYPKQRALAESVFGCRYFSAYGMTEKVVAGAECEHSTAYHVWPTYGLFELIDEEGRAISTQGQRGEIVGTSFINRAMPFIRYRTGDYATYVGERCRQCGREHPLVTDIRGHRTQESLVAGDGSLVPWSALNMHDDTFEHVERFQFHQDRPGYAQLRVVPGAHFTQADRDRILRNLNRKLEGVVEIRLQIVSTLRVTGRGKAIYVDQRIASAQPPPDERGCSVA